MKDDKDIRDILAATENTLGLPSVGIPREPLMNSIFDINTVKDFVAALKVGLDAPYINAYFSTLGGAENVSVLLSIGLDAEETWNMHILENSRYTKFHIFRSGEIKEISGSRSIRFRKARAKSQSEVIERLNRWIHLNIGGEVKV